MGKVTTPTDMINTGWHFTGEHAGKYEIWVRRTHYCLYCRAEQRIYRIIKISEKHSE